MRASDTAKHISEVTGIPAREELRLKEQNFGKYESTPRNGEEFKRAKQDFVCRYEGGESMLQLCQRIYNLLDDIKKILPRDLSRRDEMTYIEPFVGGGAVLFWILQEYPNITRAIINDNNAELICTYRVIKYDVENLILELNRLQN